MKFSCEKALLQNAVMTAGRVVAAKSSILALEGVLIEAEQNGLRVSGYNLETGIVTTLEANVEKKGSIVLSARLFGEIIRKLPDDVVSFTADGNNVHIVCGPTEFNIMGTSSEEYPELPSVDQGNVIEMTQGALHGMISKVIFAVSDNESRPIHTGVLFEVEQDELTLVAVDGYRLALRRSKINSCSVSTCSFVVPHAALSEVDKICSDSDEIITITGGHRHIMFTIGSTVLVARRLEGSFLNYRQTIPQNNTVLVEAETSALLSSIDRASLIINEKLKSPLRCKFDGNQLSITSRTAIGTAFDTCTIVGNGKTLEIGFNNRFLMEAVKAAPSGTVRLELNTPTSPCLILPTKEDDRSFLYMVLPVRLPSN